MPPIFWGRCGVASCVVMMPSVRLTRWVTIWSGKSGESANAHSAPDCMTEVRMDNTFLTVSGYFKQSATETAANKMAKAMVLATPMLAQSTEKPCEYIICFPDIPPRCFRPYVPSEVLQWKVPDQ